MGSPTKDKYAAWLDFQLGKTVKRAKAKARDIAQEFGGGAHGSSRMVIVTLDAMRLEVEGGIDLAFGQMKRGLAEKWLDRGTLRVETESALRRFEADMTKAVPFDLTRVDPNLAGQTFASQVDFGISMWDAGLLDPKVPTEPLTMTNNLHVGTMIGSAIQQGASHSTQSVHIQIDASAAKIALADMQGIMAGLPEELAARLRPELEVIRLQLAKDAPTPGILREAGITLRNVVEGIAAGALAPEALDAVHRLLSAIGLN